MSVDWHEAWTAALDALELDVAAAEALLAETHRASDNALPDPWRPPGGIGPLPLDLRPRAEAILARQTAAAQALARQMVMNRQQTAMVARFETGGSQTGPAYVDCAI
ncbi:hypothetical protein [Micromonospora pattaloongensis]|uniref:hypothetical protein n=1 Tax=Micromonospora pattaloongensis TaxID=405436 RepID=UPI000B87F0C6|nr:hypothetical protein [Micromonospora pattaloongensis]